LIVFICLLHVGISEPIYLFQSQFYFPQSHCYHLYNCELYLLALFFSLVHFPFSCSVCLIYIFFHVQYLNTSHEVKNINQFLARYNLLVLCYYKTTGGWYCKKALSLVCPVFCLCFDTHT